MLFVAEPERDHGDVDAGVQQPHGGGVPQDVRRDVLVVQGRAGLGGGGGVFGERRSTASRLSASAGAGGEQRVGWAGRRVRPARP